MGFLKIRHLCRTTAIENFNDLRSDASICRFAVPRVRHQRTTLDRLGIEGRFNMALTIVTMTA
jgi:hypothetical protein